MDDLAVTSEHLPLYSMDGVIEGKFSRFEMLIKALDEDDRPLWVSVWGGANCLAQALWKVKNTGRGRGEKVCGQLRVYTISDRFCRSMGEA